MINHIGMPIIFEKDHPVYANDLSHMTDEDWKKLEEDYKERLKKLINKFD